MTDINITEEQVIAVIEELKYASKQYYLEGGNTPLSDEEFDAKQEFLKSITTDYPQLFEDDTDGAKILEGDILLGAEMVIDSSNEDNMIIHKTPMLSLAKAKKEHELDAYLTKVRARGADDFRLQAKLDGSAISAYYENGNLMYVATRGNGVVGENVTHLSTDKNITVVGLPDKIDHEEAMEVRGELFFTQSQFESANKSRFEHDGTVYELSRSSVAGIVKRSKKGMKYPVELTFGVYSAWDDETLLSLNYVTQDGFVTVDSLTENEAKNVKLSGFANDKEVHDAIDLFGKVSEGFDIPIDGVVIKPTNEVEMHETMGNTSHHPASQIAWKYPSEKAITNVKKIVFTVGKSGRITPVAEFETVIIEGSQVSRASLHNFALLREKDVREGSVIIVEKANEIIPQVVSVVSSPEISAMVEIPENCPSCGEALSYEGDVYPPKTLNCENQICPARNFGTLIFAVGRDYLDIDGLSVATLEALNEAGLINDIADLYEISKEQLSTVPVGVSVKGEIIYLGDKRATSIMQHIEKSKSLPAERLIASFGIHTLGRRAAKKLVAEFNDFDSILSASADDIAQVEGFARIKAEKAVEGLQALSGVIQRMKDAGVKFGEVDKDEESSSTNNSANIFEGLSFAISGTVPQPFANRNAMVDYIESHGGSFHSAPKAGTSYMIAESDGSSSKVKKALTLGVEFITDEEFTAKFMN